ncbi:hypothetical protein, partial [Serratia marcescens]|uniref:hypothetical protein n=1 Tax=Serratia marcescens TaxID=615 RepID=UPI001BD0D20D
GIVAPLFIEVTAKAVAEANQAGQVVYDFAIEINRIFVIALLGQQGHAVFPRKITHILALGQSFFQYSLAN